jgi:hypothetical protein
LVRYKNSQFLLLFALFALERKPRLYFLVDVFTFSNEQQRMPPNFTLLSNQQPAAGSGTCCYFSQNAVHQQCSQQQVAAASSAAAYNFDSNISNRFQESGFPGPVPENTNLEKCDG